MTARTHDLAAITALGVIYILRPDQTITLSTAIMAVFANLVGGITPDVDQPIAPFWRNLPIGGIIGKFTTRLLGGHRFLTHSIVGLVIFGYLARLLLMFLHPIIPSVDIDLVWWAYIIGMVSHLLMDTLTKEGVPWFLPIPFKFGLPPLRKLRITTGEKIETFIIFPFLIMFNVLFYVANYDTILDLLHNHIV